MTPPSRPLSKSSLRKLVVVLALMLLPVAARAQQGPSIQWELVNSFRFIHDQTTIDELRTTYSALSDKSALALERALQDKADRQVDEIRKRAWAAYDCDHPKSKEERRQCFAPYLGWFSSLAMRAHANTCWDSKNYKFRSTGPCANYIYPKSHRVRVWVNKGQTPGTSGPRWITQPFRSVTPCEPKGYCVEFDAPYHVAKIEETTVAAEFPGQTLKVSIQVKDKLIVGLGDSYAAGEGNPDMPAQFTQSKDERDFLAHILLRRRFKVTRSPQSDDKTRTVWLDRRCHRSMYSYQFKAALQLALANPQEAITYVTFSCAGATTPEIVKKKEKSIEGGGHLRPQLEALQQVLKNREGPIRPIDYLLLSTGGNDVQFGPLVAFVVLPQSAIRFLEKIGVSEEKIIQNNRDHLFEKLLLTGTAENQNCGNYRQLQKALFGGSRCPNQQRVTGIKIRDCGADRICPRIILTPYPNVFTKETDELCDGKRKEFDRPFLEDETRAHRIDLLSKKVFEQLSAVQKNEMVRHELGWTVVEANTDAYRRHGFCARNFASNSKTGENFVMPRLIKDESLKQKKWDSFDPWEYRAYEKRQRWMRLPVDAKLSTNQVHFVLTLKLDFFLEDDRSNIMHPTAEGLATTAQLNVDTIRRLEGIGPH